MPLIASKIAEGFLGGQVNSQLLELQQALAELAFQREGQAEQRGFDFQAQQAALDRAQRREEFGPMQALQDRLGESVIGLRGGQLESIQDQIARLAELHPSEVAGQELDVEARQLDVEQQRALGPINQQRAQAALELDRLNILIEQSGIKFDQKFRDKMAEARLRLDQTSGDVNIAQTELMLAQALNFEAQAKLAGSGADPDLLREARMAADGVIDTAESIFGRSVDVLNEKLRDAGADEGIIDSFQTMLSGISDPEALFTDENLRNTFKKIVEEQFTGGGLTFEEFQADVVRAMRTRSQILEATQIGLGVRDEPTTVISGSVPQAPAEGALINEIMRLGSGNPEIRNVLQREGITDQKTISEIGEFINFLLQFDRQ